MSKNSPKSVSLMSSFFFNINHEHCFHEKSIITFSNLLELITLQKKISDSGSGRSLLLLKNDAEGGLQQISQILRVNTPRAKCFSFGAPKTDLFIDGQEVSFFARGAPFVDLPKKLFCLRSLNLINAGLLSRHVVIWRIPLILKLLVL